MTGDRRRGLISLAPALRGERWRKRPDAPPRSQATRKYPVHLTFTLRHDGRSAERSHRQESWVYCHRSYEQQIIKVPFGRSPRKHQHRGNGGQTGELSKTQLLIARRICAARQQVCTAIRSTIVLSLAARPLADHFSPSPMVGSRGSAAPALIPTIRAGRLVHAFPWSGSHGAEPSSRIGRGGVDHHGRACLRPET